MAEDLDPMKVFFEEVFGAKSKEATEFLSETNYEELQEIDRSEDSAACTNCQSIFSSINQLNIHISSTTSMCHLCGTQCCSEDNLKNHIDHECDIARRNRNIDMIAFESAQLGRQSFNPKRYHRMPLEEDVDDPESTEYTETFETNKKMVALQPEYCNMSCAGCTKKFNSEAELIKHKRTEHVFDRKFTCTIGGCGMIFENNIELKKHRDKAHPELQEFQPVEIDESNWACPICCMNFILQNSCSLHIKVKHLGWSPDLHIKCNDCSKAFQSEQKMQEHHERIHQGMRTLCPLCSTPVINLRAHIQDKHDKKGSKFSCPDCKKYFRRKFDLKRHRVTVHLGIKNFKCDICGKCFGDGKDMTRHRSAVHLGMKTCINCKKIFRKKESLHFCSPQFDNNQMNTVVMGKATHTKDLPDVVLDLGDDAMLREEPRLVIKENQDGFGGVRFLVVHGENIIVK